jgi:formate hydrogenlyase subunit 6/NADH:ubiquinone oxidoreductase subunit I
MRTGKILSEVLNHLFKKPATVTTSVPTPPGFRGAPTLESTENCISCGMCARDCPAGCITMVERDNGKKYPSWNLDKCTYCAQCAESCPKKIIHMSGEPMEAVLKRFELKRVPKFVAPPPPPPPPPAPPAPAAEPKQEGPVA